MGHSKIILLIVLCLILSSCGRNADSNSSADFSSDETSLAANDESEVIQIEAEPSVPESVDIRSEVTRNIADTLNILPRDKSISIDEQTVGKDIAALYDFINKSGDYPIYKAEGIEYIPLGDYAADIMVDELEKAGDFIFIEYFIIGEGELWDRIYDVLKRKAAEGVDVRVMYDGLRDGIRLPADFPDRLESDGIRCHVFSTLRGKGSQDYSTRDHRKIMVIDNKTVFTGGMNLADEYINIGSEYGFWKDNAIKIQGQAVSSFTLMFLQIWNSYEDNKVYEGYIDTNISGADPSGGYIMPFSDNPFDEYAVSKSFYINILDNAEDYVYITTPYLLPDKQLEGAICDAAKRGVDVRVIVPGTYDGLTVATLSKTHYRKLVESGVRLYEFTPGFIHSKIFVSDDIKAVVGTINLDNRSLVYHFECGVYIYANASVLDVKSDIEKTLKSCTEITTDNIDIYSEIGGGLIKNIEGLL